MRFRDELTSLLDDEDIVGMRALVAFASLSGIQLLGPESGGRLERFLGRGGKLDWIVGIDAVTTAEALEVLMRLSERYPNTCRVRAFASQTRGLFHPKVYLFEHISGDGVILSGSNNLTLGGLVLNTEYAVREEMPAASFVSRVRSFYDVAAMEGGVREIDGPLLDQLRGVRRLESSSTARVVPRSDLSQRASTEESEALVLVRAVNRGSDRLAQVQFAAEAMTVFFGRQARGEVVELQQLLADGTLGPVEARPLTFPQRNRNRRLQVRALNGVQYPESGQWPILVFQEIMGTERYRYVLKMPGDAGYSELEDYLRSRPMRGSQTPWEILPLRELVGIWSAYPV